MCYGGGVIDCDHGWMHLNESIVVLKFTIVFV